jgi:plasmid maintenance system antidote protein VapI
MYLNVKAEMARKNMTIVDLSNATGIRYQTLADKIRGDTILTVDEAVKIKNALDVTMPIEELFSQEVMS